MSSHSVKLANALRTIMNLKSILKTECDSEYRRGFYNGLEFADATMNNRECDYIMPEISTPPEANDE